MMLQHNDSKGIYEAASTDALGLRTMSMWMQVYVEEGAHLVQKSLDGDQACSTISIHDP
jgi:hypothetical protein